jgi:hypothetical protein
MTEENELALVRKIAEISKAAVISKDMAVPASRDGSRTYAARSEAQVLGVLRPLFQEHNVYPIVKNIDTEFVSENYIKIRVTMLMYDLDTGAAITFEGLGSGFDKSDKDAGKALTYAKKNAFLHLFNAVTNEDADNHSSEVTEGDIREEAATLLDELWKKGRYHAAAADEFGVVKEGEYYNLENVKTRATALWQERKQAIATGSLQQVTTMVQNFKAELKR